MPDVGNNDETTRGKMLGGITGKGFMPGKSGNPSGRPKRPWLTEVHDEMLEEKLSDPASRQQFKDAQWQKLLAKGVVSSMTLDELWERTEGKVTQPIDVNLNMTLRERMAKAKARSGR